MTDLYDYQQPYAKDPAAVAGLARRRRHPRPAGGGRPPPPDDARRHLGRHRGVHREGDPLDARALRPADHPADVQPDRAGRADPGEPAGVDRRRGAGRDRQPVRTGRARRHDVPDRPGQQRADVPRARARRDRLPRRDDAAVAVHRGGPGPGEARGPYRPRQGSAAGHLPAPRGLGDGRRGRHQRRDGGRASRGSRSTTRSRRSTRRCGSPSTSRSSAEPAHRNRHRSTRMAQTVAEILVDQMVEVGIRKVYGIVGDSANPIVDALRRHEADIEFVHVRNEEAGAFAAGADAQISGRPDRRPRVVGPGQPAPGQRALRLPAQRAHRSSRSRPTSRAPRSAAATSRRPTPRPSSRAAPTTAPCVSTPGQMPRISELALQAAILERGVGMVILPG